MNSREDLIETMARAIYGGTDEQWERETVLQPLMREYATEALAAIEAAGARVVPLEMTEPMGGAMEMFVDVRDVWNVALAASPFAPPAQEGRGDG